MAGTSQKKVNENIIKIICIALFVVMILVQGMVQARVAQGKIPKEATSGVNGIIAQIHVLISVALVVMVRKKNGYKTALILCSINSAYILFFGVIRSKTLGALPGVITPLITMVVCYLIHTFERQATEAHEKLEKANQTLLQENDEIAKEGEKLTHMVYYDALTGLVNKRMFYKQLDEAISDKDHTPFTVIFLNIDDFAKFNDKYDSDIGDIVLSTFGYRFHNFCGESAVVGRIAGDEFALLLKGGRTRESISSYISDLRSEVCETISVKDKLVDLTMSIGVSNYPRDGRNSKEIMDNTAKAVARAKQNGAGSVEFVS